MRRGLRVLRLPQQLIQLQLQLMRFGAVGFRGRQERRLMLLMLQVRQVRHVRGVPCRGSRPRLRGGFRPAALGGSAAGAPGGGELAAVARPRRPVIRVETERIPGAADLVHRPAPFSARLAAAGRPTGRVSFPPSPGDTDPACSRGTDGGSGDAVAPGEVCGRRCCTFPAGTAGAGAAAVFSCVTSPLLTALTALSRSYPACTCASSVCARTRAAWARSISPSCSSWMFAVSYQRRAPPGRPGTNLDSTWQACCQEGRAHMFANFCTLSW